MEKTPKYYIVEASALPEIFRKVAEAKRMLETGETDKVNVATRAVGISRSKTVNNSREAVYSRKNYVLYRLCNSACASHKSYCYIIILVAENACSVGIVPYLSYCNGGRCRCHTDLSPYIRYCCSAV